MTSLTSILRRAARFLMVLCLLAAPGARAGWALDEQGALHLLNRLGYGPAPGDVARVRAMGLQGYLDSQLAPSAPVADARQRQPPATDAQAREERLLRLVASPYQLEEVLSVFWMSWFGIAEGKGMSALDAAALEREAVRPHVFGRYAALHAAVARHPSLRGRTLAARGEAAALRALAENFVSAPPAALVRSLARVWQGAGGDQRAVLRALFLSPAFLAPAEAGSKRKDALRFVVSAVRASGVTAENTALLADMLERAGAPVYGPRTVWMGSAARTEFVAGLVQGRLGLVSPPAPHEPASSAPPLRVSGEEGATPGVTVAQPGPVLIAAPTPSAAAMAAARNQPQVGQLADMLESEAFLRY